MGPIVEPAHGKLLSALTTLEQGQSWLVQPRQLDESGKLWSPGVRDGVAAGSEFHLTEYFGPVLGVMTASTLDDAITLQNAVAYGLTAGIHSLEPSLRLPTGSNTVEAGNLYVNRGITGAIVRRQPFGGWKRSTRRYAAAKAGGPNYVLSLGSWDAHRAGASENEHPRGWALAALSPRSSRSGQGWHRFRRSSTGFVAAALSDQNRPGQSAVRCEPGCLGSRASNATCSATGRRTADNPPLGRPDARPPRCASLRRAALARARRLTISSAVPLPVALIAVVPAIRSPSAPRCTSVTSRIGCRLARPARQRFQPVSVRLVGGDRAGVLAAAVGGNPDVAIYSDSGHHAPDASSCCRSCTSRP